MFVWYELHPYELKGDGNKRDYFARVLDLGGA